MSLDLACQTKRHPHTDRGLDLYETPIVAVQALLRVETLPRNIWEPAAGRGAIVHVLRSDGFVVTASDIHSYDFPLDFERDFLTETHAPTGTQLILTNPPYMLAQQFVSHALNLGPRVIMLCRLGFLESERRTAILDKGQLARVHVFKRRLPMMHRHLWSGPRASSAIAFAWLCWDRSHSGPATIDRIGW
jgi:hypothetical protein